MWFAYKIISKWNFMNWQYFYKKKEKLKRIVRILKEEHGLWITKMLHSTAKGWFWKTQFSPKLQRRL
jgi:hypothetical protein